MSRAISKMIMQDAWELKRKRPEARFAVCLKNAWSMYFNALRKIEMNAYIDAVDVTGMSAMDAALAKMEALGEFKRKHYPVKGFWD